MRKFVTLVYGNRFYFFTCSRELTPEQVAEALATSGKLIADPIFGSCDTKLTAEEVLKLLSFDDGPQALEQFIEEFKYK